MRLFSILLLLALAQQLFAQRVSTLDKHRKTFESFLLGHREYEDVEGRDKLSDLLNVKTIKSFRVGSTDYLLFTFRALSSHTLDYIGMVKGDDLVLLESLQMEDEISQIIDFLGADKNSSRDETTQLIKALSELYRKNNHPQWKLYSK